MNPEKIKISVDGEEILLSREEVREALESHDTAYQRNKLVMDALAHFIERHCNADIPEPEAITILPEMTKIYFNVALNH